MDDLSELDSAELGVRARAIRRIGAASEKSVSVFARLFEMAIGSAEFAERQLARVALFTFSTEAVPFLLERSRAEQAAPRLLAMNALTGLRGAKFPIREQVLDLRPNAAWGVFAGDVLARGIELLRDEEPEIRLAAAFLLAVSGTAVDEALKVFADQVRDLCSAESMSEKQLADADRIALHLGRMGPAASGFCGALEHFTHSPDPFLARTASEARQKIGCGE